MASFKDVIEKALKDGKMKMLSVNQNVMEISMPNKKKPAFVKSAITEELAQGLMGRKRVAFILHADGDDIDEIVKQLETGPKGSDPTEILSESGGR